MKRPDYWSSGSKKNLWRANKSVSSLRNRWRFYVRYLTDGDISTIRAYVKKHSTAFINFESVTDNYTTGERKFHSVSSSEDLLIKPPAERRPARPTTRTTASRGVTSFDPNERIKELLSTGGDAFTILKGSKRITAAYTETSRGNPDMYNW